MRYYHPPSLYRAPYMPPSPTHHPQASDMESKAPTQLLVTLGGHHLRYGQTCLLEDPPHVQTSGGVVTEYVRLASG